MPTASNRVLIPQSDIPTNSDGPHPGSSLPQHSDYIILLLESRSWPARIDLLKQPDVQEWFDLRFNIAQREGLTGRNPAKIFLRMLELCPVSELENNATIKQAFHDAFIGPPELIQKAWGSISEWVNGLCTPNQIPDQDWIRLIINIFCDRDVFTVGEEFGLTSSSS